MVSTGLPASSMRGKLFAIMAGQSPGFQMQKACRTYMLISPRFKRWVQCQKAKREGQVLLINKDVLASGMETDVLQEHYHPDLHTSYQDW